MDLSHFFGEGFSEETEKSTGEILRPEYEKEDEKHSTYVYELDLYERVRKGNVEDLKRHLNQVPLNLNANTLATTSLRQAKNLFIKTITNVVMIGAIPGGVSVDLAYALLDSYVQEAEKLSSVREIEMLCYNMLLEFCQLAGKNKIPKGLSADVFNAMNYIRSHTDSPISVEDVAKAIGRSPSFITKRFRKRARHHAGSLYQPMQAGGGKESSAVQQKKSGLKSAAISAIPVRRIFRTFSKRNTA